MGMGSTGPQTPHSACRWDRRVLGAHVRVRGAARLAGERTAGPPKTPALVTVVMRSLPSGHPAEKEKDPSVFSAPTGSQSTPSLLHSTHGGTKHTLEVG